LNGDLLLQDGKLSIVKREKKKYIGHAFLNVEITQADIDSYDPSRYDTYLYEIFDKNDYERFIDGIIYAYTTIYDDKCYFIYANKTVKKILTYIIKTLFGSLYFDRIDSCTSNYPQVTIRPLNHLSWTGQSYSSRKLSYSHGGTTFFIGDGKVNKYVKRDSIIYTRNIDSIDPLDSLDSVESIPQSTLVRLALDIASHSYGETRRIYYNR
jgi:hypothetical protein